MKIIFNIFDDIPDSLKLAFIQSKEIEFNNDRYAIIDKEYPSNNEFFREMRDIYYQEGYNDGHEDGYNLGYDEGISEEE